MTLVHINKIVVNNDSLLHQKLVHPQNNWFDKSPTKNYQYQHENQGVSL